MATTDLIGSLLEKLFAPLVEYLKSKDERRVCIGRLVDIFLEVRHREAGVLAVEGQLAEVLAGAPPQARILVRRGVRAFLAMLGPVAGKDEVDTLRRTLAGYHPRLAFRLRDMVSLVDAVLLPVLELVESDPSPMAPHLSVHLGTEVSTAYVAALDRILLDLAELHGSKTETEVRDYLEKSSKPDADRDRSVQELVPVLREFVRTAPWEDLPASVAAVQRTLGLPPSSSTKT